MKKFGKISMSLLTAALILGFAGCASTQPASAEKETVKESSGKNGIQGTSRSTIDWDGSEFGSEPPAWVDAFKKEGPESPDVPKRIKDSSKGKIVILVDSENANKEIAREAARNEYAFQIAQSLNTMAASKYTGVIDETEISRGTIQAAVSRAQFTGWQRIGETWTLVRVKDHDRNDKITDTYHYYCVYACDKASFEAQGKKYLTNLIGEAAKSDNRKEAEALADDLMKEISNDGWLPSVEE